MSRCLLGRLSLAVFMNNFDKLYNGLISRGGVGFTWFWVRKRFNMVHVLCRCIIICFFLTICFIFLLIAKKRLEVCSSFDKK